MDKDDPLDKLGRDLNEDAKATRKRGTKKTGAEALEASRERLGGETGATGTGVADDAAFTLNEGERWHEGQLLEGFSFDDEGYVVDEDGDRTGARRKPLDAALDDLGAAVAERDNGTNGRDLSEEAHERSVDRMETMASDAVLSDRSLVFDVRDFLLDQLKSRPKTWSETSPDQQRDIAAAAEYAAEELVRKIVERIAANQEEPVRVLLTKVTIGDDIVIAGKVKTFAPEEEDRAVHLLHQARGKHVMLTVASLEDYKQDQRAAETDEEEPGFRFEAGSDPDTDD